MGNATLYPGAALVAAAFALHGFRKGSLNQSGAAAAWITGYAHLANPLYLFAATLIVFYLAGSRATKVKADIKATLEDGPDPTKPGGNRNWVQVMSSSVPGVAVALAYRYYYQTSPPPSLLTGLPRRLIFALLGNYATSLADTLASELGILAVKRPRHILTMQSVPAGTNGGVTMLGLVASAAGGKIMGSTVALCVWLEDISTPSVASLVGLMAFGMVAGLAGSLLDSSLGATLQRTLYSTSDGRVLTDHSTADRLRGAGVEVIGPGRDVLSNSAVNAICGSVMAAVGYWVGGL